MKTEIIPLGGPEGLERFVAGLRILRVALGPGPTVSLEAEGLDEQRYILRFMGAAAPMEVNGAKIAPSVTITVIAERVVGDDAT